MLLTGENKMFNKKRFIVFIYLGTINFFLLWTMGYIFSASPKFLISLIFDGELFGEPSISLDGATILFFYYLFVFSNTIWGNIFFKNKYTVCLLWLQILYFLFFLFSIYFNILTIRY